MMNIFFYNIYYIFGDVLLRCTVYTELYIHKYTNACFKHQRKSLNGVPN